MNASANTQLELRPSQPHRILLVDQDPCLLHFKVEVLLRHGYEIKTAEDTATAWKELQASNYNLLITDYKLPKTSGIGLIKKLRAAHLALPVVLVADKMPLHQLVKYPWLQPAATLLKPIAVDVLLYTVKSVLRAASCPLDNLAVRASPIAPVVVMESKGNIAEWQQTGPGIWSQIFDQPSLFPG